MLPLKRSASFKISVDRVEVEPVIKYQNNGLGTLDEINEEAPIKLNGHHNQNGDAPHQNGNSQLNGTEEEEVDDEAPVNILTGADWESVNYKVENFEVEDDITGLAVSHDYIVAQFYIEPEIHVFSRANLSLLHRLTGHDYGGQAVQILDHLLYSGSKDLTVRCWDLRTGKELSKVQDHRDYVQSICVRKIHMYGLGEDGEMTALATGGAADHRVNLYSTDTKGGMKLRHKLDGHKGWITCLEMTDTMVISGSKDCCIKLWDLASGDLLQSLSQDAEITCLSVYNLKPGFLIFGDGESKMSLLDLATGETIHLMPNSLVGTGRYRRSSKYHDKNVDYFAVTENGYFVTASSGSKFVKVWKVEKYDGDVMKTDVKELQILRDHSDYLGVLGVHGNSVYSSSGDGKLYIHTFPEGEQHYDMLRTYERNSVAVCYQGAGKQFAPELDRPTIVCEGRLCKVGKSGLARSSSSFEVKFALKPTCSMAECRLLLPQTIDEDSEEDDSSAEFVIEYVTDSEASDGDEEW